MKKSMLALSIMAATFVCHNANAKTLEDVLKEKGVITEEDYKEVTKSRPVDFKLGNGFTFTSPDEKFQWYTGGQLQFRYTFSDLDGTGVTDTSVFNLPRIKTLMGGYAFTKDLTYKVNLNWANLSNSGNFGKVMEEIIMNYRLIDEFQLKVGQDKAQYSRQWITSTRYLQFPDASFVTSAFTPTYDTGLAANGNVQKGMLTYAVQWLGGAGQSSLRSNNTNSVDVRLAFNPLGEMKYVESDLDMSPNPLVAVGASYYHNSLKKTAATTFEANNLGYAQSSGWLGKNSGVFDASELVTIDSFQADLAFKWKGISAQGEYFWGEGSGKNTDKKAISTGYYLQAGYLVVPKQVELAARFNWLDFNHSLPNSIQTQIQGALNWYIQAHNLKLQTCYTRTNIQANARTNRTSLPASDLPLNDNIIQVQAQLLF